MKAKLMVLLSGLGYYRLSEQRRRNLLVCLSIGLAVNLLALIIFGSWVFLSHSREEQTVFVAQPPLRTYEPREMEHRVKLQRRQRSSSRPNVMPRMVAMQPTDFSLPEITTDPSVVRTSFQPRFRAVTGSGMGMGLGTGHGMGGFGTGFSHFDFFGIRGRGERIAIILDVSVSMAEESEELGVTEHGIAQFARVKQRVGEVIDAFSETTLFNVIVYAETASSWRNEMQVATANNKRAAKQFIAPFNSRAEWDAVGHRSGTAHTSAGMGHLASGGTTRFEIALAKAMEGGADVILVICDGDVWTTREHSAEEIAANRRAVEEWQRRHGAALAQRQTRTERVWVEGRPARPAQPAIIRERGGRPASGPTPATEGRWENRTITTGPAVPPQPSLSGSVWTLADYQKHIEKLHEEFLKPAGRPLPIIHVIGFRSGREDSDFLRRLARAYNGQFRLVRGI